MSSNLGSSTGLRFGRNVQTPRTARAPMCAAAGSTAARYSPPLRAQATAAVRVETPSLT